MPTPLNVEVLLSNDDVTVLGPPTNIDVAIDIGPQGDRGSQIFVGVGDPNDPETVIGQTPEFNDLYIDSSPGTDYGYMYQYKSTPGGTTWDPVLKISPAIYSTINTTTFTSGTASATGDATIIIPIADIVTVTGTPLEADNFCVRYSIENTYPVASSMIIPALTGSGDNLVINLEATKYSGGSWQALTGEIKVHLFISIVQ